MTNERDAVFSTAPRSGIAAYTLTMETKNMKKLIRYLGIALTAGVAAVAITASAAMAEQPAQKLPAGSQAQPAAVVPMAIPSGSCIRSQSSTMTNLFARPGVAVTRAQMADHLGVSTASIVDSSWPGQPTPANRVNRSGESWTGQERSWAAIGSTARSDVLGFHVVIVTWQNSLPC